ncbi:MAG: helix-hairpin-helix domain-containing protein, partial [candidate division WOR-3 bacterium]
MKKQLQIFTDINYGRKLIFGVGSFVLISGIFVLVSSYPPHNQLDINNATYEQIQELPLSKIAIERIYQYLLLYGEFNSIYDLRKIKEISPEEFELIKPIIKITRKQKVDETYLNIYRIQKSLATEESPTKAAVEDWQDMLLSPMNVNKVTIDDLILLENVSLIDAIAVIRHIKRGYEIKDYRDLRDINGLSNYGFRNMRNYVAYTDPKPIRFQGNYRINFNYGYDFETEVEPQTQIASINQAYVELQEKQKFYNAGFSDNDIEQYFQRLDKEYEYLNSLRHRTILTQRIRTRIGNNLITGIRWQKDFNPSVFANDVRGFIQVHNLSPIKKLFLGDFRVALGQGILLDNSSELIPRTYSRSLGIFGDLTSNSLLG